MQVIVSIHAPAWGATILWRCVVYGAERFNPRARVGRDIILLSMLSKFASFNPRARVGRDIIRYYRIYSNICFNPRARVGRDSWIQRRGLQTYKFQSTRPRGARLKILWY